MLHQVRRAAQPVVMQAFSARALIACRLSAPRCSPAVPCSSRNAFCSIAGNDDAKLDELREKIAEAHAQIEELIEKRVQCKKDSKQAAKRHTADLENESKYGVTKFARAMLQIPDNLERAAGSVKEEDLANDPELRKLKDGVVKMQKIVEDALKQFGVTEMKCEGAVFDPQHHEAMFAMEMPGKEPNTIFHVMEPGYMIHDRNLRAAKVGVVRG
mmetsp:Transcript_64844/g.163361  ORF Transcript_64844/g.163361 Transcript_64844/m.163361 type:complete len:214 (-) Transcript_64844:70-711(-)|eukprot:CAMPEP_0115664522 /NCGR_PEP_ID=MMETSP0272-20121206/48417_1 /TAXON_ID=71861 /ORGANISM="Scrippsiella trochoidea, Strain CCMP3099" /LENGTH=213 /DNA_ID=CAMNT_0003102939 /DNA_START=35 /DNA_END=676 /DNA_ORIENTATION=+